MAAYIHIVISAMVVGAPVAYLETGYQSELADLHGPMYRLRCILNEYRFMARDELREKLNTLLERLCLPESGSWKRFNPRKTPC